MELINFDLDIKTNIIGVDEVGRGSFAGDVFAGAVHFSDLKNDFQNIKNFHLINDSKQLSINSRKFFSQEIKKTAFFALGKACCKEIDKYGISKAVSFAMKRAVVNLLNLLKTKKFLILVDGIKKIEDLDLEQTTLKKGDSRSFHIACASIIAKVERDAYMDELHKKYSIYNWQKNKGYGTLQHRQAIIQHGYCEEHRKLFLRKLNLN